MCSQSPCKISDCLDGFNCHGNIYICDELQSHKTTVNLYWKTVHDQMCNVTINKQEPISHQYNATNIQFLQKEIIEIKSKLEIDYNNVVKTPQTQKIYKKRVKFHEAKK